MYSGLMIKRRSQIILYSYFATTYSLRYHNYGYLILLENISTCTYKHSRRLPFTGGRYIQYVNSS